MGDQVSSGRESGRARQERKFRSLHLRMLIYNACVEDPAIDGEAMRLTPRDRVLVITSGGCNALAYLLAGAGRVEAVDVNPCQTALLELKVAAIRGLDYPDFWEIFGRGRCKRFRAMYHEALRERLSPAGREFWDARTHLFQGSYLRPSFYQHGGWGLMMWLIQMSWKVRGLRGAVERMFLTRSLEEQWEHYVAHLRPYLWQRWFCWLASRPTAHYLMGIPPRQREFILNYPGGLFSYGQRLLDDLVARVAFATNYFMHVNALGRYRGDCCPEYLTRRGFEALKGGLLERLHFETCTVTDYLGRCGAGVTKLVLLDHMDWLEPEGLRAEWEAILEKATPGAMILFRSALESVEYLDGLMVSRDGREVRLDELLEYERERAAEMHLRDRVHLYGSFSIAKLAP